MKGGRDNTKVLLDILSDFDVVDHHRKNTQQHYGKYMCQDFTIL